MSMSKTAPSHNLHVPLPENLYGMLRAESHRSKMPATILAREAIGDWLRRRKKSMLDKEIRKYAANEAGTKADLDNELEAASIDHLLTDYDL